MTGGDIVAICLGVTTMAQIVGSTLGAMIKKVRTEAKEQAEYVTKSHLDKTLSNYPTKEYVDGNNKLLRLEVRGLRKDIRDIQMHRALAPLEDVEEEEYDVG